MLEARSLTKTYSRIPAVENASFTIKPGEVLGYLGPNGSGKSTTVGMITGLLEPTEGQILWKGSDIRENLIEYKRSLGYVPEIPHLYSYLTGPEFLQLTGRLRGIPEASLESKIKALMELFSLTDARYVPLAAYSKGMKQKILISAAILHNPHILVFDEPLSGLDVTSALIFRDLVCSLAAAGKVILYSSHVLEVVEKLCTKVVILSRGRVVANDSVEGLRELMRLPSLEHVFAQLVEQEDTAAVAARIIDAVQA